jgi:hypothetical protein
MRRRAAGTAALGGAAHHTAKRASTGPQEAREADDAAPPAEPVERVKELDELREQGILTEEEFAAEKKKLLGI